MSRPSPRRVGLVVLTGGASTRMGRDKASLAAGGMPLARRPVEVLRPLCSEIVLAGRPVAGVEARVVPDAQPGRGPLAGLVAGVGALATDYAVVVACDMPEVQPALVGLLLDLLGEAGASVQAAACSDPAGRLEPLPLALRTSAAPRLQGVLDAGCRALREGLAALATMVVAEPDWRAADPAGASFENWNRPADIRPLPTPTGP